VPKEGFFGSYAMNRHILNKTGEEYWRRTGVKKADNIPVFLEGGPVDQSRHCCTGGLAGLDEKFQRLLKS